MNTSGRLAELAKQCALVWTVILAFSVAAAQDQPAESSPPAPDQPAAAVSAESAASASAATHASNKTPTGPRIQFAETSHDFGTVYNDTVVSHIFKFTNTGDQTLLIENVKTGCGCTSTLLGKKEIAPGETGEIEVKFNTRGKHGLNRQTIGVFSNDPTAKQVSLGIVVNVQRDLTIKPLSSYMGNLGVGESKTQKISLIAGRDDLEITKVETSSPDVKAVLNPLSERSADGHKQWELEITMTAREVESSMMRETVTIHTNSPNLPKAEVFVQARVVGDITLNPTLLYFGSIKPGQSVKRDAVLMSRKGQLVEVDHVSTNTLPIKVNVTRELEGKMTRIEAEYTAPDKATTLRGNLDIYLKGEKIPLKLYVMGNVRP
ncbi:MAG: hypothetical protein Kow0059_08730 [Candidatus Sumerlaeia bacterium]